MLRGVRMALKRSRLGWICDTIAPWALASGLLVSFTASAGHSPVNGFHTANLRVGGLDFEASAMSDALILPTAVHQVSAQKTGRIQLAALSQQGFIAPARSITDGAERGYMPQSDPVLSEAPPRAVLKRRIAGFPEIDRSRKSDPLLSLRPSLSRLGRDTQLGLAANLGRLLFSPPDSETTLSAFVPGLDGAEWDGGVLMPWSSTETTDTGETNAEQPPAAGGAGQTGPGNIVSRDGSTPSSLRASALSSTTPAPADATPIQVAALPVSLNGLSSLRSEGVERTPMSRADPRPTQAQPRYTDLINPNALGREQRCLAEAVYFEARSEGPEGQAAVAQVVLNRVRSGLYPNTVCGVVYQNQHRHLACQFTFACEGKSLRIGESASWQSAVQVSQAVLNGKTYLPDVGGSTHYHADYVRPYWAKRLKKMDVIGRHIFYKLRPGQT
jgi:spore germination cell wall hydrolase CwlJ-like protein